MPAPSPSFHESDPVLQVAGQWLARRDRGLTAAEQDEYLHWLRQNPRHGAAMAQLDATWGRLDGLMEWRPDHSAEPNPHLLDPGTPLRRVGRRRTWRGLSAVAAVAAVVSLVALWSLTSQPEQPLRPENGIVIHEPRHMTLPDGSSVQLNTGATVEVAFIRDERRMILVGGEAHFAVTKDPNRPFIVDAGGVTVRAVGTAFNVARDRDRVTVLVSEGSVRVDRLAALGALLPNEESILIAGQRAVVFTDMHDPVTSVTAPTAEEMENALAWQAVRLEFAEIPLAKVVDEFNRHNERKLAVGDVSTGSMRVGGHFRADNVDAFVRLLEAGFGVTSTQREDGVTILTARH